jgi:hypothetical protein
MNEKKKIGKKKRELEHTIDVSCFYWELGRIVSRWLKTLAQLFTLFLTMYFLFCLHDIKKIERVDMRNTSIELELNIKYPEKHMLKIQWIEIYLLVSTSIYIFDCFIFKINIIRSYFSYLQSIYFFINHQWAWQKRKKERISTRASSNVQLFISKTKIRIFVHILNKIVRFYLKKYIDIISPNRMIL